MSDEAPRYRTPYADDAVQINPGTTTDEVHQFVRRRAENPFRLNGAYVWNFSTHEPNMSALDIAVEQFGSEGFVIPYQLNQTWAYIQAILPEQLQEASILRYDSSRGYYDVYRNFYQESEESEQRRQRSEIAGIVEDITEGQ